MNDEYLTIELEVDEKPEAVVIENEDGSATIDFDPRPAEDEYEPPEEAMEHGANLALYLPGGTDGGIAGDLLMEIEADISSRGDWEKTYEKGLMLLGFDDEQKTEPWPGASGVYHPMLCEALYRYQAQAMSELMPAAGPAKTKVVGTVTPPKEKQALRVQRDLNYVLTERVTDYREETEKLLLNTGAAGSAFRKWYYDEAARKPAADFVPAEDIIVPYGAKSLATASRVTHRMFKSSNQLRKMQVSGLYRDDIDINASYMTPDDVREAKDKAAGVEQSGRQQDLHTVYEIHADYEIPGFEFEDGVARPYVITIDKDRMQVLAIYRNWREGDESYTKVKSFIHFPYAPGFGFYGNGLIHLMYGTTKAATATERQLIDAGTLANLPAGFKTSAMRINAPSDPLIPGEFRDVDMPSGGALRDQLMFAPYKEPSATLNQLKNELVEEGRRVGSSADLKVADMSGQMPVGTMLAIIERSTKIQSAVHARLHASMKEELRLVAELIRDHEPDEYPFEVEDMATRAEDYDERVDVIPVSDPNASTMAHRIMQMQAVTQLAAQDPEAFNRPELYKNFLTVLGVDNIEKVLKLPDEVQPRDPVTENMAMLTGEPVKAALWQDHEAHIAVHMSMAEDPKIQEIVGKSPTAQAIVSAMDAHVREHVAYQYRAEIEKQMGVPLPPLDEQLPPEVEPELAKLTADAAERVLEGSKEEIAQQEAKERAEDPVMQLQLAEVDIKRQDADRKDREVEARIRQGDEELEIKRRMPLIDAAMKVEGEREAARRKAEQEEKDRALERHKIKVDDENNAEDREAELDVATMETAARLAEAAMDADARERERKDQMALARAAQKEAKQTAKDVKSE
ncbi:MAG: hypothetical protein V6Z86_05705 [Hyphomicrobiales bacterium]